MVDIQIPFLLKVTNIKNIVTTLTLCCLPTVDIKELISSVWFSEFHVLFVETGQNVNTIYQALARF